MITYNTNNQPAFATARILCTPKQIPGEFQFSIPMIGRRYTPEYTLDMLVRQAREGRVVFQNDGGLSVHYEGVTLRMAAQDAQALTDLTGVEHLPTYLEMMRYFEGIFPTTNVEKH